MIGMFSLVSASKWQSLAHLAPCRVKTLGASTDACMDACTGLREYPHATSDKTTIRTPSPDGQSDKSQSRLPVFLPRAPARCGVILRRNECRRQAFKSRKRKKGSITCLSRGLRLHSLPLQVLRLAATRLVNKLSAGRPLAQVLQSSPMMIWPRALPLVQPAMLPTASFIPPTATNTRRIRAENQTKAVQPQGPHGFFALCATPIQTKELPKRDCPCSTRF